jgi:DNA modification methylase
MSIVVLRADARRLPLPDASVDLIVTSPPYWALRSYGGYDGEIGSEPTPQEYLETLWQCAAEWMRVLKPEGSMFIDLGDKYASDNRGSGYDAKRGDAKYCPPGHRGLSTQHGTPKKSLLALPWRFAIGCVDKLGLILREDIIWAKPNGLPESVTDRCRRAHEYVFHLTKQPRYYSAVDEIREAHAFPQQTRTKGRSMNGAAASGGPSARLDTETACNPLGKLPGSVWTIPSEPLILPDYLSDHFAAFPSELPRRIIAGWCPREVCTACGQGRWPVAKRTADGRTRSTTTARDPSWQAINRADWQENVRWVIIGYACDCTPYTDHPATGEQANRRASNPYGEEGREQGVYSNQAGEYERVGPWREHHFDQWTPARTTPGVVLDPFSGTGTSIHTASALGCIGIGVDRSKDHCRTAVEPELIARRRAKVLRLDPQPGVTAARRERAGQAALEFGGDA